MFALTHPLARAGLLVVVAVGLSAAAGLAFAGWMEHAPGIFMVLAQQGLAWCF